MSDWNNWKWEKSMTKRHSSVTKKNKAGEDKTTVREESLHFTWKIKLVPTIVAFLSFYILNVDIIYAVLASLLLSFLFTFEVHTDITEKKQ